ncbi:hypothetical protein ALC56_07158, partial [Trachymyrmex septentrionalis]
RILGRRFILTPTIYKYLDVGIVVGPVSFVEIAIGDNQGNNIILPREIWLTFIERHADIEWFVQSIAPSSLLVQDLVIKIVKMRDVNVVKLILHKTCLYIKPSTVLFMFELKHCESRMYSLSCASIRIVYRQ